MAALRLGNRSASSLFSLLQNHNTSFVHVPFQLVSCRGIAHKLFVGGLSFSTTDENLSEAFSQYGQVIEAKVVMNQALNRSKGFGFVKFASEEEAEKAISEMNGKVLHGRVIYVDKAKIKPTSVADETPIARGPPQPYESENN
ncbi:hypothetical protein LUZ60_004161 [Juncus effusus]|nr:hypothetical protein LUZ60_004161 [Juncus effusus]